MNTTLASDIEHRLRRRHIPELPDHFVLPHYGGYSIANIAPTIAQVFGIELEGSARALPEDLWLDMAGDVECVILLLVDAAGYLQLRRFMAGETSLFSRLALEGRLFPITSAFPSTTVTALTSIWTGETPLAHGFLGTTLLLPEQGVLANMLKMAPAAYAGGGGLEKWGWNAEDFIRTPSLAHQLEAGGVRTVAHTRRHFIGSILTQIFLQGIDALRGYLDLSDLWVNLRRTLVERRPGERLLVDVYWGGVDNVGHVYGTENPYMPAALRHFTRSLEEDFLTTLAPEARENTLLIVAADHGQIATPPERVVRLPDHPGLQETLLLPPAGESRAAYLYARPGAKRPLRAYVHEHLAEDFVLVDTEHALEAGLWGPAQEVPGALRVRLGDAVLVARNDARLSTRRKEDDRSSLRGHHGSLTPEEMLVPLLMARLDAL
ncbi:MAG: alkaline phosphatase family protein [Chloroflexota bacterium]|nr:alkaline phosphatase family protein [Chloroflexota bacterium]